MFEAKSFNFALLNTKAAQFQKSIYIAGQLEDLCIGGNYEYQ